MRNPAWCPWQLHLARAESHDAPERAVATALDAVNRARRFGVSTRLCSGARDESAATGLGPRRPHCTETATLTVRERSAAAS